MKKLLILILVLTTPLVFCACTMQGFTFTPEVYTYIDEGLTPVAEPESGTILSGTEIIAGSKITINAASNNACVVKLKDLFDETCMSFYVRAGDTVTVNVPSKHLYVYFASGTTWYGENDLFGSGTSYQKVDEMKDFTMYTWEFELHPVAHGNLSLATIDEDEF